MIGPMRPRGPDPKRHHYVPKFYLERFSDGRRRIAVHDRRQEVAPFVTASLNAAVISGLYTLIDSEGGLDPFAEDLLSKLESDASLAMKSIDEDQWEEVTPEDDEFQTICLFIATQFVRTPEHRFQKRVLSDLHMKAVLELTYRRYGIDGVARFLEDSRDRPPTAFEVSAAISVIERLEDFRFIPNDNQLVLDIFEDSAEVEVILHGREWTLLRTDEDLFLTSDRPVVPWRTRSKTNRHRGVGPANAEEVYFPLDPRQMLVISEGQSKPWSVMPVTRERADQINRRVAHWATRWIYHRPEHDVLHDIELPIEGPILHINGIPVREDIDVWATIKKRFIDGTSLPVIHAGFGVNAMHD